MTQQTHIQTSFRAGMRRLASGVSIISTQVDGQRHAMTASSVTSVSDDPVSLLVCINKNGAMYPKLLRAQPFVVNVLSQQQQELSNFCAIEGNNEERFSMGQWGESAQGVPYLQDCQVSFFCEVDNDDYCYGTHQIVIGRITDIIIADNAVDPLVYLDGRYVKITADS